MYSLMMFGIFWIIGCAAAAALLGALEKADQSQEAKALSRPRGASEAG